MDSLYDNAPLVLPGEERLFREWRARPEDAFDTA
jgi:hypothetical protein